MLNGEWGQESHAEGPEGAEEAEGTECPIANTEWSMIKEEKRSSVGGGGSGVRWSVLGVRREGLVACGFCPSIHPLIHSSIHPFPRFARVGGFW